MLSYSQESYFDSHQSVTDIHRMMIVFYFSIVPSFFVYNLSAVSTSRLGVLTKVHRRINILSIHYTTILVSSVEWPATESWVSTFLLRQFRIGDRRSLVCHQKARKWRLCLRTTVCVKREKGKESKWQEVCLKRNGRRLIIINRPVARIWTKSMKTLMNIFWPITGQLVGSTSTNWGNNREEDNSEEGLFMGNTYCTSRSSPQLGPEHGMIKNQMNKQTMWWKYEIHFSLFFFKFC